MSGHITVGGEWYSYQLAGRTLLVRFEPRPGKGTPRRVLLRCKREPGREAAPALVREVIKRLL
jgi:hypothetical protein